ncbi:hypothetical protein ACB316_16345 [Aeromonas sanarellii]
MWKMIMKLVSWLVLIAGASSALAGPVIVNQGMSSADTFALRDRLAREHEWQEWLRFQQAIKWLEVLPVNCDLVGGAGGEYRCGDDYYRPYRQNGRDIYIQGDPPGPRPGENKKAP